MVNDDFQTVNMNKVREAFKAVIILEYGSLEGTPKLINRQELEAFCGKYKVNFPQWLLGHDKAKTSTRGVYNFRDVLLEIYSMARKKDVIKNRFLEQSKGLPRLKKAIKTENSQATTTFSGDKLYIPEIEDTYVPMEHFPMIRSLIESSLFFPVFLTGLSGNGKTMMVEQACAHAKREYIRVNITSETDEDDLIGGFRLKNGSTEWHDGPVTAAMERGAILLLDEIDLASNKIMALQPILEGQPLFLKKINKIVHPKKGFNILATANTKGQGSENGKFAGTQILNEAFLERFPITIEHEYPEPKIEINILRNLMSKNIIDAGYEDKELDNKNHIDFIDLLIRWAGEIRKGFKNESLSDVLSTRRLCHLVKCYVILGFKKQQAVQLILNRFDAETKAVFMDLYTKIDKDIILENQRLEEEAIKQKNLTSNDEEPSHFVSPTIHTSPGTTKTGQKPEDVFLDLLKSQNP